MFIIAHIIIQTALVVRVLLRPHRDPASRIAWIVVILALPIIGLLAYLLLGEVSVGRKRLGRMKQVLAELPDASTIPTVEPTGSRAKIADHYLPLFNVGRSISRYEPVFGNKATLMADSNSAIDAMVADIDAAKRHVHLLFYIWMPDNNGRKMAEALKRAAARGVTCRAMVDDIGSRLLIKSNLWLEMGTAGVRLGRALRVGNPFLRIRNGRVDLRNHRKILVIDNRVTYCGSQNCADPEFLTKAKFAPWIDAVMRFTGPIVRQNQHLFCCDWMANTDEAMGDVLLENMEAPEAGFPAQVIATGPTYRPSAAPEIFETLMYSAHRRLFITTPYYVPIDALQGALCAAANRGVAATIIFPARNDDFAVGAICRSYYADLLAAGVRIYEYQAGLLHTKSMTVDEEITLIGSTNMDRRSFDLNFENNILLVDAATTLEMRNRQERYLEDSREITADEVSKWNWKQRLWNNTLAIVGPVL